MVVLICSIIFSFFNLYPKVIFLLFFYDKIQNKIIKFKITNRIKRLFFVFFITNSIILVLDFICNFHSSLFIIAHFFSYYISFAISCLIERIILQHYLNKAKEKIKLYKCKIIAITGSFGKTTTKNFIYELIKDKYFTLVSPFSYNTFNGLLLTINKYLRPFHEYLIIEIGVDRKNGMNKFIKHFCFDISAITCIGNQHLKTFKTIANISAEKQKIYLSSRNVIINFDDSYIKCSKKPLYITSINYEKDIYVAPVSFDKIIIKIMGATYFSSCNIIGKHNLSNLAIAIAISKALNIPDVMIVNKIALLKNTKHRLSISYDKNFTIIDDSYNSNYRGFLNALDVLSNYPYKKILITPGIIETNEKNSTLTQTICEKINKVCDLTMLIKNTEYQKHLNNYISFLSFKDAYDYLKEKYHGETLVVLIENDLPDIYLR